MNPEVLRWARESAGFDPAPAAQRIGVPLDRLSAWETGETKPTVAQVRSLAEEYRRPPAFFLLPAPPEIDDVPRPPDLRRGGAGERRTSVALLRELSSAAEHRSLFLSAEGAPVQSLGALDVDASDPIAAARAVRSKLQVTAEEQLACRGDLDMAFSMWTSAVEELGTLVFQTSRIRTAELRGIAVHYDALPLIVLNANDAVGTRSFTLFHELFHLLRGAGGICDLDRSTSAERAANRFASEILMPSAVVSRWNPAASLSPMDFVPSLARECGLSEDVAAMALRELNPQRMSAADVRAVQRRTVERLRREAHGDGFAPHFRLRLRDLGRKYVAAIFNAYHSDDLTLTDVAQRLRVKVPQVSRIEEAMFPRPTGGSG